MGATLAFNGLKEMKTGVPEVKRKKKWNRCSNVLYRITVPKTFTEF